MYSAGSIRRIFRDIAASIKEKTGNSEQILPTDMPNVINNMKSVKMTSNWLVELTNDADPTSCVNLFRDAEYYQPVYISPIVTNCAYMFYNTNFQKSDLYFLDSGHDIDVTNMLGAKRGSVGVNIYCKNATYIAKTGTNSVIGAAISWDVTQETNRNCYYNSTYNIRIYDNWRGS